MWGSCKIGLILDGEKLHDLAEYTEALGACYSTEQNYETCITFF